MLLLDFAYHLKQLCDVVKAFFSGFLCKGRIHIGPLIVFTGSRILEVVYGFADTAVEQLEPHLCVFLFVVGSFGEESCNLLKAFFFCLRSIEGIFVSCLRFTCKCSLKILFCFSTF